MGEMVMKKILLTGLIVGIGIQISCMQLEYIDPSAEEKTGSSSGSGNAKLQISKHRLDTLNISYYEAILICNKMSRADNLDTLYQYDELVLEDDSFFWLQNIKVLENRSGYRLPTREEWLFANENEEMEDIDDNIGEWLYKKSNAKYGTFELAPNFLKAVGLYKEVKGHPVYGMRVLKVVN